MKRNGMVILGLTVGITLMLWSGVMAYRERKAALQQPRPTHVALIPDSGPGSDAATAAAGAGAGAGAGADAGAAAGTVAASEDPDSPAAQGLSDLRGKMAPAFTLKSPDGKTVSLSDYKGKAVLLNFWATWCAPCKLEMPWLIEMQKQYAAQGFTVLGVSEDDPPTSAVAAFVQKMGIDYPVVMANDAISKAYGGVDSLPTSYYIGRDGKILIETAGLISKSDMDDHIQKILATKGN